MVGWFDPAQLFINGMQVLTSAILGTRTDYRLLESLTTPTPSFDYGTGRRELWFDFVADLGDGWNSTYSIASLLARPTLTVQGVEGSTPLALPRGEVLLMGGDEVYPVASRKDYEERTVLPYETAFPSTEGECPSLFALPGNHDWYDGLIAFTRLFCQQRSIGAWKTRQNRSYFALKLPSAWWVFALDIQLEKDIDKPQKDYFADVIARETNMGDRVILMMAEPQWIEGHIYDPELQHNLTYLYRKLSASGLQVKVLLAGDFHHYRRHTAPTPDIDPRELIVCGGGGAFLHPTCGPDVSKIVVDANRTTYELKKEFPTPATSLWLLFRNLAFPFLNPWFGVAPALTYLALAWGLSSSVGGLASRLITWQDLTLQFVLRSPGPTLWALALVLSFVLFTDTHKRWYKWLGGTLHAAAHLSCVLALSAAAEWLVHQTGEWAFRAALVRVLTMTVGGYFAGGFVMGLYLLLSLLVFHRHATEAFASLRIEDYKSFLRLHITPGGNLRIYPIGLHRAVRRWVDQPCGPDTPSAVPAPGESLEPFLIEEPIEVS